MTTRERAAALQGILDSYQAGQLSDSEFESCLRRPNSPCLRAKKLVARLLANGVIPASLVRQEAAAAGISWRTIVRVKLSQNIRSFKKGSAWYWTEGGKDASRLLT